MNYLALDFETYYDPKIGYTLGVMTAVEYIRDKRFEAVCCSFKLNDGPVVIAWGDDIRKAVEHYRALGPTTVIGHNLHFDGLILAERYGWIADRYIDTVGCARALLRLERYSLEKVAAAMGLAEKLVHIGMPKGKRLKDFTPTDKALVQKYCERDTELTWGIARGLAGQFSQRELDILDWTIKAVVNPMVEVDYEMLEGYVEELNRVRDDTMAALGIGLDVIMSNPKLAGALEALNVTPPMKISYRTGKLTYAFAKDDEGLTKLLNHPDERVQGIVAARLKHKSTIEQSRAIRLASIGRTGRLPVPLLFYGAHTGRLSGSGGINLQNLTRKSKLRRGLVAPPGCVFVVGDSSQIECRVLALVAGQQDLMQLFKDRGDPYCEMAEAIYGHTVTKDENPDERWLGKVVVLGCGYGMGWPTFKEFCRTEGRSIDDTFARRIIRVYRKKNKRIALYWERLDGAIKHIASGERVSLSDHASVFTGEGKVEVATGFPLLYPGLRKDSSKGKAGWVYNARGEGLSPLYGGLLTENIVQKLARDVVMEQLLEINKLYPVVLTVHDEIVAVVKESAANEAKEAMLAVMSRPPAWMPTLPVAAEVKYHRVYGEAK